MNVIAAVSRSGYEYVMVSEFNTTGSIFYIFLRNLIQHLKLKYEEYFAKIILMCDGARYHQIKKYWQFAYKLENNDGHNDSIYSRVLFHIVIY